MVLETLGAWSSVEQGIEVMLADGRIEAVKLVHPNGTDKMVARDAELITAESLERLRRIIVGRFSSFELSSSMETCGERLVQTLIIIAS